MQESTLIELTLLVELVAATLAGGVGHADLRESAVKLGSFVDWDGVLWYLNAIIGNIDVS